MFVKVMSSLISVMSSSLVGVLAFCVSFVSCIVIMPGCVLCEFFVPRFCF